jgi:hypothetical protein
MIQHTTLINFASLNLYISGKGCFTLTSSMFHLNGDSQFDVWEDVIVTMFDSKLYANIQNMCLFLYWT